MTRIFMTIVFSVLGACRSSAEEPVRPAPSAEPSSPVAIRPLASGATSDPLQEPATATAAPAVATLVGPTASAKHQQPHHRFVCPMHPNVVRHAPGDCPECGMHLVARD